MATVDMGDYGAVQQEDTEYSAGGVSDLDPLIAALAQGVSQLSGDFAVNQIEFWQGKLQDSPDTQLASIGSDLAALRDALADSDTDAPTLGDIMLSLGNGVQSLATGHQDVDLGEKLRHLSTFLIEPGQSLASEDSGIDGVTDADVGSGILYGNPTTRTSADPTSDDGSFANQ